MQHCHIAPLLSTLGKKWMTHIMATISKTQGMSFGDIRRSFPYVNATLLSTRLKELQQLGFISKKDNLYIPTNKLMYFKKVFQDINNWHKD